MQRLTRAVLEWSGLFFRSSPGGALFAVESLLPLTRWGITLRWVSEVDRRAVFILGLEAYRNGEHHEAHEHWEEIWQDEPDVERGRLLQALIQVASAAHKATHDVAPLGAVRLLQQAEGRLRLLPERFMAVDVAQLRVRLSAFAKAIEAAHEASGQVRLAKSAAPEITILGEVGPWGHVELVPLVPDAARAAWFEEGLLAYARAQFFDAHELWEQLWRDECDTEHKQFLQGLIQVAAAMHKVQAQHKPGPAGSLLARALLRLRVLPDAFGDVQIDRLVREIGEAQAALLLLVEIQVEDSVLAPELVPTIVRASVR